MALFSILRADFFPADAHFLSLPLFQVQMQNFKKRIITETAGGRAGLKMAAKKNMDVGRSLVAVHLEIDKSLRF